MSDWKTKDQKIHATENEDTRLGNIMADLATFYSLHAIIYLDDAVSLLPVV